MTTMASLSYAVDVSTGQAVSALDRLAAGGASAGVAIKTLDQRVGRTSATFDAIAGRFDATERAQQNIAATTAILTKAIEAVTAAVPREARAVLGDGGAPVAWRMTGPRGRAEAMTRSRRAWRAGYAGCGMPDRAGRGRVRRIGRGRTGLGRDEGIRTPRR